MHPNRIEPGPGEESVWDYPRPPRLERVDRHIQVVFSGQAIADTRSAWRVLETSHPPVYYVPPSDIAEENLVQNPRRSFCEWKGQAHHVDVRVGDLLAENAGWYYPEPTEGFRAIKNHLAFYPEKMDRCLVDGELVKPQPGGFYGGWITADILGPFKGEPGTEFW
jgi:uncharacterized protein (DUF427 family)